MRPASYPPRFLLALLAAAVSLAFAAPAFADDAVARDEHTEVALIAERGAVVPATPMDVGIVFRPAPGWHVYWKEPGDAGTPPAVDWKLPPGFTAGPLVWPAPHSRFGLPGVTGFVYEREAVLLCRIDVPSTLEGDSVSITAAVEWLVCDAEGCKPGFGTLTLRLPVRPALPEPEPAAAVLFKAARDAIPRPVQGGTPRAWLEGRTLAVEVPMAESLRAGDTDLFPDPALGYDISAAPSVVRGSVSGVERFVLRIPLDAKRKDVPARFSGVVTHRMKDVGPHVYAWAVDAPVAATPPPDALQPPPVPVPDGGADVTFLAALFLAFAGGLLLNLMPCVLPVLAVKVLGFVEQAGQESRRVRRHGYAFGIGVLGSFWALAGLLLALRAGGEALGWGFQFQVPGVVAAMSLLLFAVGLNLLGVFEVGTALAGWAGFAAGKASKGYGASFWNGVLATVIATPCTAPFMGPAVGFALVRPPVESLAVFSLLGLGMAAPYVVLSFVPRWLRWIPRPGPWMVTFKQAMAFPVFATVIWLGWVFSKQTGSDGLVWLWVATLALAAAGWFHGRFGGVDRSSGVRWIVGRGLAAVALAGTVWTATIASGKEGPPTPPPVGWEEWSEGKVAAGLAAGRPVFVDFTADWCMTCKFLDETVLSTDTFDEAARKHGALLLQADWTHRDAAIAKALQSFGRSSVPLYVVYSPVPGRKPEVLPTAITPGLVADAIARAAQPAGPSE